MENPFFLHGILDIVIGTGELALAVYFFRTHSGSRMRQFYALFVFGVALWVITNGIWRTSPLETEFMQFVIRLTFFASTIIASSFLIFSWLFPYPIHNIPKILYWIALLPILLFGILFLFTNLILSGVSVSGNVLTTNYESYYPLFGWWFIIYWTWAVVTLTIKRLRAQEPFKSTLTIFLIGIYGSSIIGVFTNLMLPLFWGIQDWGWLGPMASVLWLGMTSYIIVRNR